MTSIWSIKTKRQKQRDGLSFVIPDFVFSMTTC